MIGVLTLCHHLLAAVRTEFPEPVAGWRMELVAQAPRIRHPSVVAVAPDGRIFLAEDPMDISLPNANAAEGRILCLGTNGQATVFADKLYAVFGLQYLEGRVYVLHNPKFSVYEDQNGVGINRRDLIEQTLPDPSALNWNDHVPANFRLAMDGYFYVACGDKGLYRARGTDGSTASLPSGGIFRIRPDGTGLEVFAHGVRNILDVALNAEDEIFSYDNTDEHDWMGRFSHMVEAGFYGYPHDFVPRRPYTLWMMDDFGPGAACGAFAYNEDALPAEFEGNIFLSDFGKRQVMRVRVERQGATYRVLSREDLFPNPPGDFRPVGIALGPDGKSIYICDWQHRDEKEEVSVGRLWKLTWAGADRSTPRPGWYLPAALGQRVDASTEELIRGLAHPSHAVRLAAQRTLSRRRAGKEMISFLENSAAPARARVHALWALDAVDRGRTARGIIANLTSDSDPLLRRQSIRQLAASRATNAAAAITARLRDPDASVQFSAATALGRLGHPAAVSNLLALLDEPDLFARYAVFTALNHIGTNSPGAWPAIVRGLESEKQAVREGTSFALRETYQPELVHALLDFIEKQGLTANRLAAIQLLSELHHRKPEWKGEWRAYHPALQPPPPKTERWEGSALVLERLRAGVTDANAEFRRICIQALISARDIDAAPALRAAYPSETDALSRAAILSALAALKDPAAEQLILQELRSAGSAEVTVSAVRAAGDLGTSQVTSALLETLRAAHEPALLAEAAKVLAKLEAKSAIPDLGKLAENPSAGVRVAALESLASLQKLEALPALDRALGDSSVQVRFAAVRALDRLRSTNCVPALLNAYADDALRGDALFALARVPDERALEPLLDAIASKNTAQRNAAHLALREISEKVLRRIEARAGSFSGAALRELQQIYAGNKQAELGPIFAREIREHTPEEYLRAAVQGMGNPARGHALFGDRTGLNCIGCHRVAGDGSDTGPDLTGIGAQFDSRALAESVLYPSKAVREGYQQIRIETADDESFSGVVKAESADAVALRDAAGQEHTIPRASIKSRSNSALSLMPEGLQAGLSLEEFADLIAYLGTLKGESRP